MCEFNDVFSDKLGGKVMNCKPMKIELRSDIPIKPVCFVTARKVPLHFEAAAAELIAELLAAGVIERVDHATTWTSPAHFVEKGNTGRVRLVCDFTHLNKFVARPTHPFPSVPDIVQTVDPKSRYFAKADLCHGYFQVPLAVEDRDLTTFILPCGRYRFTAGSYGFS